MDTLVDPMEAAPSLNDSPRAPRAPRPPMASMDAEVQWFARPSAKVAAAPPRPPAQSIELEVAWDDEPPADNTSRMWRRARVWTSED